MKLPRFWIRNGWTLWHVVGALVFMAIGVTLTFEAWADIFTIAWNDEESSQVLLVPPIFAWLVWVRRGRFRFCSPTGTWIGVAFVAVGWAISSFGYYNGIQSFWHAGSVLIVVGCLLSVVGKDILMRFLPAFAVLVFLVPVPGFIRQQIAIPLQGWLAQFTQIIFDIIGMEITRSGNLLKINGVPVAIAEACNGMRMVFTLTLISYAFSFGTPLRGYARAIIIAASPITALVCNVIRMVPTVWIYGQSRAEWFGIPGNELAEKFHDIAGWVMLVVAFLLLMSIIRVLRWAMIPVTRYTLAYD